MSTLALDSESGSSGSQIIQATPTGGLNQKWYFIPNGSGYYTLRNVSSGLYLADPGGSKANGTKLEQLARDGSDSQLWSLTISGSGYVIHNKASGLWWMTRVTVLAPAAECKFGARRAPAIKPGWFANY